jgi:hypothetical protein
MLSGFTDEQRILVAGKPKYEIGSLIKYKHAGRTAAGVPREAVYVCD